MSFKSNLIFETALNNLNPFRDQPIDQDFAIDWYHNGAKGFHHATYRCSQKNKNTDMTRSRLSLNEVAGKRLCPNCFQEGLLVNFFNGAIVFNHLLELCEQLTISKQQLAKEDLSIYHLTTTIEKNEKYQAMLLTPDIEKYQLVIDGHQTIFNAKVITQAQDFDKYLKLRLNQYQSKIELDMVGSYLSSYAEENLDKFFKEDELKLFTPSRNVRNTNPSAISILKAFFSLRSKLTSSEVIKLSLMEDLKTIAITDIEQLNSVPMITSLGNLKSTVELSWESYKLSILEPLLERWEKKFTKQLSETSLDLLLVNTTSFYRSEHLKVLFPYYKVQEDKTKDLVVLKTPHFVTLWAKQNAGENSYMYRSMDRAIKVFSENSYTPSELNTALVLYEEDSDSVFSDFQKALTAAQTL